MQGVFHRFRASVLVATVLVAVAASDLRADAPSAAWTPVANDPVTFALDLSETLLNRGVPALADVELANVETLATAAPKDVRCRFGVLALRAALESANLETPSGRDETIRRVGRIRDLVEGADFRKDNFEFFAAAETLSDLEKRYALALARTFYALGALEFEFGDGRDAAPNSPALDSALELTKYLARTLSVKDARPFLYWHAKSTLANLADDQRVAHAERFAAALEKNSRADRDAYWFFASALLVETARAKGDLELASRRLAAILAALKSRADDPEAPREIAAALVALELRLLQAEGKETDALRQATQNVDLLDAPFPENAKRLDETFDDPFDELNLARAELYWRVAPKTPTRQDVERLADSDDAAPRLDRETLVAEARRVSRLVGANAFRARCRRLAQAAGETSGDWRTLEIAAQEAFHARRWRDALDAYDRAAKAARDSGDLDEYYRLAVSAAALVDKIVREKQFADPDDETRLRRDAARRFESFAREKPNAEGSDAFMLLALEYRESLGEDDPFARFEYLKLFPNAANRAEFALDLARRSFADGAFDDARRALDYVTADDPRLPDALALERAISDAQIEAARADANADPVALVALALTRIYDRLSSAAPSSGAAPTLAELARRLDATRLDSLAPSDSATLAAFFDLASNSDVARDPDFVPSLTKLLAAWRGAVDPGDADALAKVDAARLSLALANDAQDAVVAVLSDATSDADLDLATLERTLALAQNAKPEARKKLAQFVLDALPSSTDANPRADVLRADALRLLNRAQESLNLFARLRKNDPKNVAVARGVARILTAQKDEKTLRRALVAWSDVAELLPEASKEWWDAKEETVKIYCRLGDPEQAEKIVKTLWLARDDASDPGRRRRCEKAIEDARASKARKS